MLYLLCRPNFDGIGFYVWYGWRMCFRRCLRYVVWSKFWCCCICFCIWWHMFDTWYECVWVVWLGPNVDVVVFVFVFGGIVFDTRCVWDWVVWCVPNSDGDLSLCLMWCGARAVGFLASLRVSDFQLRLDFLQLMASDFQLTFGALLAHGWDSWQTFGRMHCTDTNKMLERRRFGILRAAISFQTWRKRSRPASVQSKTWVQGPNGLQRGQTMGQWVVARRQWAQNNSPNEVHLRSWPGSEQKLEFSICAA